MSTVLTLSDVLFEDEKTLVFIDGVNLYTTMKALEFSLDFSKLATIIQDHSRLVRINYYTLVDRSELSPLVKMTDWLDYNGFNMIIKTPPSDRRKGNVYTEIAVDMLEATHVIKDLDHLVLFSGESEFSYVVNAVKHYGMKTTVVSTINMVADQLRRAADNFIDLRNMIEDIRNERFDVNRLRDEQQY